MDCQSDGVEDWPYGVFQWEGAETHSRAIAANHYDLETGEEYWVSGIKKNGPARLIASLTDESAAQLALLPESPLSDNFAVIAATGLPIAVIPTV
jgi:hypothetical protein